MVNSRHSRFVATPFRFGREGLHVVRAYLIPKLRYHFAEFLNHDSLKRLRILSSPTCVGLEYGQSQTSTRNFSWKHGISRLLRVKRVGASSLLGLKASRFYPTTPAYGLKPGYPSPGRPSLLRPSSLQWTAIGTGILTCFPSTTLFSLALGSD